MGISFSYGVFFKSIESAFDLNRATTSSIFSAYLALGCIFALLGGWALDKYGPRIILFLMGLFTGLSLLLSSQASAGWQLFITYSLLMGFGAGAIYVVTMSPVMRWFDKKRGLAVGIAISGGGLGQVIMAPLATYLIGALDWRMAFVILGLISWVLVVPLSQLIKRDPYQIGALPDGVKSYSGGEPGTGPGTEQYNHQPPGLSLWQALRTRSFWLFCFSHLLMGICMLLVVTHIVPHVTDIGFSPVQAATVFSLIGGTMVAGTVLMGFLSDRIGRRKTAVICALVQAATMVWLIWANGLWMLYLFALVYGFFNGGLGATLTALIGDTLGLKNIGKVLGMLEIGWGIGSALGPVIGGLIFDMSNSYAVAFVIAATVMFLVALLIALVRREINTGQGV